MVAAGSLVICFLPSKDQLADIFTKPLSLSRFDLLQTNLNVLPTWLSLRESVKDKVVSPKCVGKIHVCIAYKTYAGKN